MVVSGLTYDCIYRFPTFRCATHPGTGEGKPIPIPFVCRIPSAFPHISVGLCNSTGEGSFLYREVTPVPEIFHLSTAGFPQPSSR